MENNLLAQRLGLTPCSKSVPLRGASPSSGVLRLAGFRVAPGQRHPGETGGSGSPWHGSSPHVPIGFLEEFNPVAREVLEAEVNRNEQRCRRKPESLVFFKHRSFWSVLNYLVGYIHIFPPPNQNRPP